MKDNSAKIAKDVDRLYKLMVKKSDAEKAYVSGKTNFLSVHSKSMNEKEVWTSDEHMVAKSLVTRKNYDKQNTIKMLQSKGLNILDYVTIDGKAIDKAVQMGKISIKDVADLITTSISVRIDVK